MQDAQNNATSNEYRSVPISILVESATLPEQRGPVSHGSRKRDGRFGIGGGPAARAKRRPPNRAISAYHCNRERVIRKWLHGFQLSFLNRP
jgi:hypothetical protein